MRHDHRKITKDELIQELIFLADAWEKQTKTKTVSDWEEGYNVSCGSRAEEVKDLLKRLRFEEKQ